jgi:hypothetical protein
LVQVPVIPAGVAAVTVMPFTPHTVPTLVQITCGYRMVVCSCSVGGGVVRRWVVVHYTGSDAHYYRTHYWTFTAGYLLLSAPIPARFTQLLFLLRLAATVAIFAARALDTAVVRFTLYAFVYVHMYVYYVMVCFARLLLVYAFVLVRWVVRLVITLFLFYSVDGVRCSM